MCNFTSISVSECNTYFLSNDVNNILQNYYFAGLCVCIYIYMHMYILTSICLLFQSKILTNINIGHTKRQIISHFFISRINKSAVLTSGVDIVCYLPIAIQAKTIVTQVKSTLDERISQYL